MKKKPYYIQLGEAPYLDNEEKELLKSHADDKGRIYFDPNSQEAKDARERFANAELIPASDTRLLEVSPRAVKHIKSIAKKQGVPHEKLADKVLLKYTED